MKASTYIFSINSDARERYRRGMVIAPLEQGKELPAGVEMKLWRLLEPQFQLAKGDGAYIWRRIDAFGVIPCAGQESAGLRMLKQK
jgi:hypothetical protein